MRLHSPLLALALSAAATAQQQVVLPDNHHLTESATQLGTTGETSYWRTASAGRFQILYDASHFTSSGVTGPIAITKLMFRGEDGEPNLGGQSYSNVVVQLGSTSIPTNGLSTTFATNQAPPAPNTTTMGLAGTTNVTVLPSVGSTPNNYAIVIDLAAIGASIVYDPTSAEPNLLIDVTLPTAAVAPLPAGVVLPMQDTTGAATFVRGAAVTSTSLTTGTADATPLVVGLEFAGSGGSPAPVAARNESFGAACGGSPSTFYQNFLNGQAFDLGTGLTLIPNSPTAPTIYTVAAGAGAVDPTKVNAAPNSTTDDALVTHALGFTFAYPGGTTATIKACTNGYVWLDSTMTAADFTPTIGELLGTSVNLTARLMPFWFDFHPGRNTATHPNSGMHVLTDTSGGPGNAICYVTWFNTGILNTVTATGVGGHAVHDMQCVLFEATGVVEFRYGSMPAFVANASSATSAALVGFTRGRITNAPVLASVDPESRDLSHEVPFSTHVEGAFGNMGQVAVATPDAGGAQYGGRMFGGQTLRWNVNRVPAGSLVGVQLLDIGGTQPGLFLPGITAPGCILSTTTGATLWEVTFLPAATVTGTVPLLVPSGFDGTTIVAQYVVLNGLLTPGDLISSSSNAIRHTVGRD